MAAAPEVFISYSHLDEAFHLELVKCLKPLERDGLLKCWHDGRIEAGQDYSKEILAHLETARVILLLVSRDFLASDYCFSVEMARAVARHELDAAHVIPIILRHSLWESAPFGKLKVLPKDGKPIAAWDNADAAYLDVTRKLRTVLVSIGQMDVESAQRSVPSSPGVLPTPSWEPAAIGLPPDALASGSPLPSESIQAPGSQVESCPSPLRFAVFTDPVHIRSEGMTELMGDIFVECAYMGSTPPVQPLWFNIMISLGTNITSRLASNAFGEAISGDPVMYEIGRPDALPVMRASGIEGNVVTFGRIQLDDIRPNEKRIFRISNIRINAAGLWLDGQLLASVSVGSVEIPSQVVATAGQGLEFEVRNTDSSARGGFITRQSSALPLQRIASLRFSEGFPNAFKSRTARHLRIWNVWKEGKVYHSESCLFGPVLQMPAGRVNCTGLADYGTRLQAQFDNILPGIKLYVSTTQVKSRIHGRLVESESTILDGTDLIAGVEARQLRVEAGSAVAVWEVDASPERAGSSIGAYFEAAVFAAYESDPAQNQPALGTFTVNGSFAPVPPRPFSVAAGAASNEMLSIPRFYNASYAVDLMRITR